MELLSVIWSHICLPTNQNPSRMLPNDTCFLHISLRFLSLFSNGTPISKSNWKCHRGADTNSCPCSRRLSVSLSPEKLFSFCSGSLPLFKVTPSTTAGLSDLQTKWSTNCRIQWRETKVCWMSLSFPLYLVSGFLWRERECLLEISGSSSTWINTFMDNVRVKMFTKCVWTCCRSPIWIGWCFSGFWKFWRLDSKVPSKLLAPFFRNWAFWL